jgi:hypothetical protein
MARVNKRLQLRYSFIIICITLFQSCRPDVDNVNSDFPGKPKVPDYILQEHRTLLSTVDSLALLKDSTGLAAIKLQEVMHHHFKEEEDYVLPVLGLLTPLAEGKLPAEREAIIQLTEKLRKEHNHMIAEHQLITALLQELVQTSKREGRERLETYKRAVLGHATAEEVVYFPAAILVGDYLKLKTK